MLVMLLGASLSSLTALDRVGEPLFTLSFLLALIGCGAALACVFGAYSLGLHVRYLYGRASAPERPRV